MGSMMFLMGIASLVLLTTCRTVPRQYPASIFSIQGAWFENIATRPNGNLLLTRMDVPELWEYDFSTETGALLQEFPDALVTAGIAELEPDTWAVVAGQYSSSSGATPGSWTVHKVDLTGSKPVSNAVANFPESELFNGMAGLNSTHALPGDASAGTVHLLDTTSGTYTTLKSDVTMNPSGGIPFGIDGMKYHDGYLYYTNIATGGIHRFAIAADGIAADSVELIVNNLAGDDFAFGDDGRMYLATNFGNSVVAVDTATGDVTNVATVNGGTSVAFGTREGIDDGLLYVATSAGEVFALEAL